MRNPALNKPPTRREQLSFKASGKCHDMERAVPFAHNPRDNECCEQQSPSALGPKLGMIVIVAAQGLPTNMVVKIIFCRQNLQLVSLHVNWPKHLFASNTQFCHIRPLKPLQLPSEQNTQEASNCFKPRSHRIHFGDAAGTKRCLQALIAALAVLVQRLLFRSSVGAYHG